MLMKRWESPRREGRNDKGKKSSARQRQIKKATKALLRKIKGMEGKEHCSFPFLRLWVNGSSLKTRCLVVERYCG
jgi:hypothetical protein